jgi:hypothetical protein
MVTRQLTIRTKTKTKTGNSHTLPLLIKAAWHRLRMCRTAPYQIAPRSCRRREG